MPNPRYLSTLHIEGSTRCPVENTKLFVGLCVNIHRLMQVDSKVTLGVGGIVIVLMAVACALGIFGYAGVTTTLLTIEVSGPR
jgi:hypothetical protein